MLVTATLFATLLVRVRRIPFGVRGHDRRMLMQETQEESGDRDDWPDRPSWGFAAATIVLFCVAIALVWLVNYLEARSLQ